MKGLKARITKGLQIGSVLGTCDNSGAKMLKLIAVKNYKSSKGRRPQAGVGDLIMVSVIKGKPDMRKTIQKAVIVRQRRPYRRPDGTWIKFEDNSAIIIKDDLGNPKGTIFKGPIAREISERWPLVSKVAKIIV